MAYKAEIVSEKVRKMYLTTNRCPRCRGYIYYDDEKDMMNCEWCSFAMPAKQFSISYPGDKPKEGRRIVEKKIILADSGGPPAGTTPKAIESIPEKTQLSRPIEKNKKNKKEEKKVMAEKGICKICDEKKTLVAKGCCGTDYKLLGEMKGNVEKARAFRKENPIGKKEHKASCAGGGHPPLPPAPEAAVAISAVMGVKKMTIRVEYDVEVTKTRIVEIKASE
ncbi:MAG: hypothetical protein PHP03_02405 [Candidatus Pacebacteria bacterium]|nr:hypothetical protein [Candidatus Paceibacterota bacterium]